MIHIKSNWEKEAIKNAKKAFNQRENSERVKGILCSDLPEVLPLKIEVKTQFILTGILEGENPLPDDHPIFYGYTYVIDHGGGQVIISNIQGTVLDLKQGIRADLPEIKFTNIYNCNRSKRNIL